MDTESIPRWGWLLGSLFAASILAQLVNLLVLFPLGLPEAYQVVTMIAAMSPVLIYVGVWYDEDRQHYWEYSRLRIAGDVSFVVLGAVIGSSTVLVAIVGTGLPLLVRDVLAMGGGFLAAWGLFWWRNPDLYRRE